ncbi:MAG: radical SAM protein [Eubacteriales bacterium]
MAKKFKESYPNCVILFGGHHVGPGEELLENFDFIDILLHGEGEEPFTQVLLSTLGKMSLESIPNLSFRKNGKCFTTAYKAYTGCDYPSPYLEGYFDHFFIDYPDLDFMFLFETNRGCAYNCSYCDWGSLKTKIRQFPMERIFNEFEWASNKKIEFFGCADANFGILGRDETIIDRLIELKNKTGYPQKFQTSYAKNNSERIFNIGKKLDDNDMNKGVTLAFQTMSPVAAENVGRSNISIRHYTLLMKMYNAAKIPTYTELILGLPGETYQSFANGINQLIKAGQHHSIYIHNCEWLPCSTMGSREYIEQFEIGTTFIPLNQPHMESPKGDEIPEYSQIVTKTYSMDNNMWIDMNRLSYAVQCFHHMNLLQFFAIYLFNEEGIEYIDFYKRLISYMECNSSTVCGQVFKKILQMLKDVINGTGALVCYDKRFGDIAWPFEEYAFLEIVYNHDKFYDEIKDFLISFKIPDIIFNDLLLYQRNMIKIPNKCDVTFETAYNFHSYFADMFEGKKGKFVKRKNIVSVSDYNIIETWEDYARFVVWYGRKESKNIYTESVTIKER